LLAGALFREARLSVDGTRGSLRELSFLKDHAGGLDGARGCVGGEIVIRSGFGYRPLLAATMPQPLEFDSPPARRSGLSRITVVSVWAFVASASIAMTTLGILMKSGKTNLLERMVWDIGWLGWAPLTYVVLRLCRDFPVDRQRRWLTLSRLALFGVGVVALQVLFDFAVVMTLSRWLLHIPFTWRYLLYVVVYKVHIYYGVYWMIVGAAHAIEFHRRYRETELISSQLEAKLANAELARLKAQLQPHFLFNTHNTIVALMLKNENEAAIRMVTRLSDLLRLSLSRSGQQVVTVREELEALRLYLEIQRERFRDRLAVDVAVTEDAQDAEIPHLLLQPIVENALLHGLEGVTENARLKIQISAREGRLVCEVRDNGGGFTPEAATDPDSVASGIGLSNTRERLQQLYGAEQSLVIASAPGGGCAVTIRVPLRVRAAPRGLLVT